MKNVLVAILIVSSFFGFGQSQNKPKLTFLNDSVLIGEPTPVSFSFKHTPEQEVLFPDSTFDFSPFEYEYREVFVTTTDSLSHDSCVYYLSTFELDEIQTLRLPAFIYTKKDSVPVFSSYDSIILTEVIPTVSDTLKIKENTDFQEVETDFNTLLFASIFGGLILIIGTLGFLFRKQIVRFFKIRKLKKSHEKFLVDFEQSINSYHQNPENHTLEVIIIVWKKYLEKVTQRPFTKWSTKEIRQFIEDQHIIELLQKTDGQIFGGIKTAEYDFELLKNYAISRFENALLELQND